MRDEDVFRTFSQNSCFKHLREIQRKKKKERRTRQANLKKIKMDYVIVYKGVASPWTYRPGPTNLVTH